jgi:hypothetical protein
LRKTRIEKGVIADSLRRSGVKTQIRHSKTEVQGMLRNAAAVSVLCLLGLSATTIVASANVAMPQASAIRTVLVVPHGARFAPKTVGRRDCIAYPRSCVNGIAGIEVAYAVIGKPPARTQAGTVLTDTNCQADSYGISHCTNRIRLASGRVMTVRHDHSMMNDPCLSPGEHVLVRSASTN